MAMSPSLYEVLMNNFTGELDLHQVSEQNQMVLSVLDNMQRILNCRAGTLAHLPDYGLPDMSMLLHDLPGTTHGLLEHISATLLKYEPRLNNVKVRVSPDTAPGYLYYFIDVEIKNSGWVRYGTEFLPEGQVLVRHLKQQEYL